jgi:4-amino-4-deoxy-L-arabinose transferase-like glycosyltransferase
VIAAVPVAGGRTAARLTAGRREIALVAAVVALAVALRLPGLFGDGVWRDQANVWVQLSAPNLAEFFRRVTATEWHPPLYFVLAWCWAKLAGTSEFALEIVPFAFSIATVPLLYRLGRELGGVAAGALAAGLFAVAPLPIAYAAEYLYPPSCCASTLLALLVVRARTGPLTAARAATLALAAFAVVFSHYTGLLFVPLLAVFAVAIAANRRRGFAVAVALGVGTLPFAAWLPIFLVQRRIGIPYRTAGSITERAAFFVHALGAFSPVRPLAFELLFGLVLAAALAVVVRARRLQPVPLALGVLFLVMLALIAAQNLLENRYALPYLGVGYAGAGWILACAASALRTAQPSAWRRWGQIGAVTFASLLVGSDAASAVLTSRIPKSGIRTIAHAPSADAATLYVLAPDYLASTFAFYARDTAPNVAGFVRWDQPEIFRLAAYAADWNRADAVDRTLARVRAAPARITEVDLVIDDRAGDSGGVPYGRVSDLLARLRGRYRLLDRSAHPGRYEAVTEYRFARLPRTPRL